MKKINKNNEIDRKSVVIALLCGFAAVSVIIGIVILQFFGIIIH